jgi:hypothetical protein
MELCGEILLKYGKRRLENWRESQYLEAQLHIILGFT